MNAQPEMLIHGNTGPRADRHPNTAAHLTWKPLHYLNLYRLTLSLLLVTLNLTGNTPSPLGSHNFELLFYSSLFYLFFSIACIYTIQKGRPAFPTQLNIQVLTDIAINTLMMHASGGADSGLGALLLVAVAGGSLMSGGRTAAFFAAIAALAILLEQLYTVLEGHSPASSYTQTGLLGATFFATAMLGHTLAKRLRDSEALAERRGVDLANMAQLTEYIIQRMQTGIVVLDSDYRIRLINESARHLLELEPSRDYGRLEKMSPVMAEHLKNWQKDNNYTTPMFRASATGAEIMPRFATLGDRDKPGTMIFIEDMAALAQQAQQLKLASLGRLTASIAHEIRNPLGAISHAGQLLAEAELGDGDHRLTEIIQAHSLRVNTIIENIMQLSRRQPAHPEELELRSWLDGFLHDFGHDNPAAADKIDMSEIPENLYVRFDSSQLQQVINNLCQNGLRHGGADRDSALVSLQAGISHDSHKPYLDVSDNGPGVAGEDINKLFEPFFTTSITGTGLGLYIARELCESNQARLDYVPGTDQGACFRITFADTRRQQVV